MPRKAGPKPSFIIELDESGNVVAKHKLNKQGSLLKSVNPKGITVRTKNGMVPTRGTPEIVEVDKEEIPKVQATKSESDIFTSVINDMFQLIDVQNWDLFNGSHDLTQNISMLFDLI